MSESKPIESDSEASSGTCDRVEESPEETAVITTQRDPVSGQFLPGNKGGGRPKGSRDKVSNRLVSLMTDLVERRGEEMLERIADSSPSDAMAILTRIIPQAELQRVFLGGDGDEAKRLSDITVRLVDALPGAPTSLDYQSPAIEDNSEQDQ
jgi:hypothetical protein